jgi:hypothetical protein
MRVLDFGLFRRIILHASYNRESNTYSEGIFRLLGVWIIPASAGLSFLGQEAPIID